MNSERARLTLIYGGLMVLAGVLLTALVYALLSNGLSASLNTAVVHAVPAVPVDRAPPGYLEPGATQEATTGVVTGTGPQSGRTAPAAEGKPGAIEVSLVTAAVVRAALNRLITVSAVSLAGYAVLSTALAWWMAGWVLRPVGLITNRARMLSASNLHERLTLRAPPGELKELADTFDEMLDRIEGLVAAQQRFAANAAHQLRTPIAIQRAAAEIGLSGEPSPEKVARIRDKLIENADESKRLIDGLLLLAGSDQGLGRSAAVSLDEVTGSVLDDLVPEQRERQIAVQVVTEATTVEGDAVLLGHLAHNLIFNALRHNHPGGTVQVRVGPHQLEVVNTGPVVPPETVPLLFEPFRQTRARSFVAGEGAGLGLSVVASIARAHRAQTRATANPGGGLTVRVLFPRPDSKV